MLQDLTYDKKESVISKELNELIGCMPESSVLALDLCNNQNPDDYLKTMQNCRNCNMLEFSLRANGLLMRGEKINWKNMKAVLYRRNDNSGGITLMNIDSNHEAKAFESIGVSIMKDGALAYVLARENMVNGVEEKLEADFALEEEELIKDLIRCVSEKTDKTFDMEKNQLVIMGTIPASIDRNILEENIF